MTVTPTEPSAKRLIFRFRRIGMPLAMCRDSGPSWAVSIALTLGGYMRYLLAVTVLLSFLACAKQPIETDPPARDQPTDPLESPGATPAPFELRGDRMT